MIFDTSTIWRAVVSSNKIYKTAYMPQKNIVLLAPSYQCLVIFIEKNFAKYLEANFFCHTFVPGEMAEWSNAAVLKTVVLQGTGGSNPSLSAIRGVAQSG